MVADLSALEIIYSNLRFLDCVMNKVGEEIVTLTHQVFLSVYRCPVLWNLGLGPLFGLNLLRFGWLYEFLLLFR